MPLGSRATALATRPSDVTGLTLEDCVLPFRTALWKNVYVPAVESRPTGAIVELRPGPPTSLQLVTLPRKMSARGPTDRLLRWLAELTSTHRPSRNSWRHVVPESLGSGGRVLTANWLRPCWTSLTPALPPS